MGIFLSISIVEAPIAETKKAILNFSASKQGLLKDIKDKTIEENNILYTGAKSLSQTISLINYPIYDNDYYYCSNYLSKDLETKVITIHIYDGEIWFLYFFDNGSELFRYTPDPVSLEEKKEDWLFRYDVIQKHYNIDIQALKKIITDAEITNKLAGAVYLDTIYSVITSLGYTLKKPNDLFVGYKNILPKNELQRITKDSLSLLDLMATKRYQEEPLLLTNNEVNELFDDYYSFIENIMFCKTCDSDSINNNFYLNIPVLCLQVFGDCPNCEEDKQQMLLNYGFIHIMEKVQDFLNR